jgi:hypothetical protein
MNVNRRQWAIGSQAIWMLSALVVLAFLEMLTLDFYFIISFIGFLAVAQLFAPSRTSPTWWRVIRLISLVGLVVLGYLVYQRVMTVIS